MEGASSQHESVTAYQFCSDKNLSILFYNARSLLPKFDELCAFCENNHPGVGVLLKHGWVRKLQTQKSHFQIISCTALTAIDMVVEYLCIYIITVCVRSSSQALLN